MRRTRLPLAAAAAPAAEERRLWGGVACLSSRARTAAICTRPQQPAEQACVAHRAPVCVCATRCGASLVVVRESVAMAVAAAAGTATGSASTSRRCQQAAPAAVQGRWLQLGRHCQGHFCCPRVARPRCVRRQGGGVLVRAHWDAGLLHSVGALVGHHLPESGALWAGVTSAIGHLPLAYEPVALPCSLMKCGDVVHRRCVCARAAKPKMMMPGGVNRCWGVLSLVAVLMADVPAVLWIWLYGRS